MLWVVYFNTSHLDDLIDREVVFARKSTTVNMFFQPASPRGDGHRSRIHWLQSNQPLLRMFLSYCSLHGSHGGGLASVRMELILLLQESHQVN